MLRLLRLSWLLLLNLLICLLCASVLYAQDDVMPAQPRVIVRQVDSEQYPAVTAYIDVYDERGRPWRDLQAKQLFVRETAAQNQTYDPTSFYLLPDNERPLDLVLVLNRGVHIQPDWEAVRQAAIKLLASLSQADQVSLLVYSDKVTVIQSWTADKQALIEQLSRAPWTEMDNTHSVLHRALIDAQTQFESRARTHRSSSAVVLITDRSHTSNKDTTSIHEVIAAIDHAAIHVPLYILGYGKLKKERFGLEKVAHAIGAKALLVPGATDVGPALTRLLPTLRPGYQINYVSPLEARNTQHSLIVKLADFNPQIIEPLVFTATAHAIPVAIYGVAPNAVVAGEVVIATEAQPRTAIAAVQYSLDDDPNILATGIISSSNHLLKLDMEQLRRHEADRPPEPHLLMVKVTDTIGNEGTATLPFQLAPLPAAIVQLSTYSTTVGASVLITATPSTNLYYALTSVAFWQGDQFIGVDDKAPFTAVLNTQDVSVGDHVITIYVTDSQERTRYLEDVRLLHLAPAQSWWVPIVAFLQYRWLWIVIVTLLIVGLFLWLLWRWLVALLERARVVGSKLAITNQGNLATAFQVCARETTQDLTFFFSYKDELLLRVAPTMTMSAHTTQLVSTGQRTPAAPEFPLTGRLETVAPRGRRPVVQRMPPQTNGVGGNGVHNATPSAPIPSQSSRTGTTMPTVGARATQVAAHSTAAINMLQAAGMVLGRAGQPILRLASAFSQTQYATSAAQRNLARLQTEGKKMIPSLAAARSPASVSASVQPQPRSPAAQTPAPQNPTGTPTLVVADATVAPPTAQAAQDVIPARTRPTEFVSHEWVQTPMIAPGATLWIDFVVCRRFRTWRTTLYTVYLDTRAEGQPGAVQVSRPLQVRLGGLQRPGWLLDETVVATTAPQKRGEKPRLFDLVKAHRVTQRWFNILRTPVHE